MRYIPTIENDLLILDKTILWKNCLDYAIAHKLNVLYTDTTSTSSVEVIMAFKKAGYQHELYEMPVSAPGGIELDPKIFCRFTYN